MGRIGIARQRANTQPALLGRFNGAQGEPIDVHQPRWPGHAFFHQIDQVGSIGNDLAKAGGCSFIRSLPQLNQGRFDGVGGNIGEVIHAGTVLMAGASVDAIADTLPSAIKLTA